MQLYFVQTKMDGIIKEKYFKTKTVIIKQIMKS